MTEIKQRLMDITKFVQKNINADDYELYVTFDEDQHTRFAQNTITQNIAGDDIRVYYRCIKDKKVGSATSGQIDEASLLTTIRKAETIAENNCPDPDIEPTLEKSDYPEIQTYFPSIEKLDTKKITEIVKQCITFAESKGGQISGIVSKGIREYILATGNGFLGYQKYSDCDLSMTLRKDHIETKVAYGNRDFDKLSVEIILARLNSQFDSLTDKRDMDFEKIPVILRPQAVYELFMFLSYLFNRKSADEGLTPFTGQLGQKFFGDKLSLKSAIDDPEMPTSPFDSNNVHLNIDWLKDGTILNMPTSRNWAYKQGLTPSSCYNLIIPGEGKSEAEMMKLVKRGFIINNLWYIRLNDLKTADLTGMTRDGVLYFENGEVKYAVNNFRFNEKLHLLTRRIIATGKSTQLDNYAKVPAMLIDEFNFVDKTSF